MTPRQFRAWRARNGLSQAEAAIRLGLTVRQVKRYDHGERGDVRDEDGEPREVRIPRAIALACAAIEAGLAPE